MVSIHYVLHTGLYWDATPVTMMVVPAFPAVPVQVYGRCGQISSRIAWCMNRSECWLLANSTCEPKTAYHSGSKAQMHAKKTSATADWLVLVVPWRLFREDFDKVTYSKWTVQLPPESCHSCRQKKVQVLCSVLRLNTHHQMVSTTNFLKKLLKKE